MDRKLLTPLAGLMFLVAVAGPPADEGKSAPEYVPDPAATSAKLVDSSWVVETAAYSARLRRLDDESRRAFLREKAGAFTDPFAHGPDGSAGFITFALEIESRAAGSLVFQPQNCRLITNRKEIRQPLDLPTIEAAYGLLEQEVPPAYRAARPALFDGERVLTAGEKAAGLIVYRGIDPKTKTFVVEVLVTTPDGNRLGFDAAYRRAKKRRR